MSASFPELRNGVVLAELGGHGDGPYGARHAAGAALAMLGTYIVDARDEVPYPAHFVFKPGRASYAAYLRTHVAAARAGGARVGVSVISVKLEDSVDFLRAAEEAGADYASLCAHSDMEMFIQENLGEALNEPRNRARLTEWATALVAAVRIPVIFKMGFANVADTSAAIETLSAAGVPIVHVRIAKPAPGSPGLLALRTLASKCTCLIAGGGIADIDAARRVLDAGAQAVALGTAAMRDPGLCRRIQKALRA